MNRPSFDPDAPEWALYTILYAQSPADRPAGHNFVGAVDFHDVPMPLDFFVWLAVGAGRVVLIDSGCSKETCISRGHIYLRCPTEGLRELGVEPGAVTDIIVTHMHWDHLGNLEKFPNARLHVHKAEMAYATGCNMCHAPLRRPYDVEQVCDILRALYAGRVSFTEQSCELFPGFRLHPVGGHAPGLQIVEAKTARGTVVLASDAMHFYANGELQNPYAVVVDVPAYLDGLALLTRLADSPDHIVPGHDPLLRERYRQVPGTSLIWDVSSPHALRAPTPASHDDRRAD